VAANFHRAVKIGEWAVLLAMLARNRASHPPSGYANPTTSRLRPLARSQRTVYLLGGALRPFSANARQKRSYAFWRVSVWQAERARPGSLEVVGRK
jgi:hypothetical protein